MLRLLTYKVVNDANDALNVFAEMVSIKLALQSLREKRKKDSFSKILILWPNPVKENNNRNKKNKLTKYEGCPYCPTCR